MMKHIKLHKGFKKYNNLKKKKIDGKVIWGKIEEKVKDITIDILEYRTYLNLKATLNLNNSLALYSKL